VKVLNRDVSKFDHWKKLRERSKAIGENSERAENGRHLSRELKKSGEGVLENHNTPSLSRNHRE